ncbi:MAG: hypothetical protein JW942_08985 [Opitutales bacterium]|nr:hypothetical protein [Opitutales bacterium]
MRHPNRIFITFFLFLIPSILLKAEVALLFESGFETDHSVTSKVDTPPRIETWVSGSGIGQLPEAENDSWINLDVVSSHAWHSSLSLALEKDLSKHFSILLCAGIEHEQRDMTLFAEEWVYFYDYNPFYPDSPLQSNGSGNIKLSSDSWTPQLQASLKWKVTDKISMNVDAGWGYSFESYDDFDFFTPTHQVMVGIDEIESITCTNSYETQRWLLGTSIDYVISNKWTASVGYQFIFLEDLSLKNTVLSKQKDIFIFSLPLENRKAQRITFSATYRF